jgi:PAS domain S-box-containing protein
MIDKIPALAWSCLPDGTTEFINQRWLEYTGLSKEQALGWGWKATIHPDDLGKLMDMWQGLLASGEPSEEEARMRRFDGQCRWFLFRVVPLRGEQGEVVRWYGTNTDIDDLKRLESLLSAEKRTFEMIASGAGLPDILENLCRAIDAQSPNAISTVLLMDADGKRLWPAAGPRAPGGWNQAIAGGTIGPRAGSCGTAAFLKKLVITSDIASDPLWVDYRDLALSHGLRASWSQPLISKDRGVLGTFAMYYAEPRSPTRSDLELIEGAGHIALIAIERKQAEEKLRESEAYLAEAQRLSHTGSWAWIPTTGEMRYWSEECYRVLGFDPDDGQPRFKSFFLRIHPDDQVTVWEKLAKAKVEKAGFELDYRIVHPSSEIRNIHAVGHPVLGSSGDLAEFVGTVIDVTERKRAEEERERLRQALEDLAHVNRVTMMGELTASLAHEVNQPIAAAVTDANTCIRWLTRDQPDLEEAREAASRTIKDAIRAGEIIRRIRLPFKKGMPQREPVDINEVVREMIVLLRGETTRHLISVRTELAEDLPRVIGDRIQLQQVLMNLIMNSIDAMKGVDGSRDLAIKSQPSENEHLMVSVSDTGIGLPSQQGDQIFNAFFTTKPHGTGMGLRISRSIVESHGGRLWSGDNSPVGASFHLTLPTKVGP